MLERIVRVTDAYDYDRMMADIEALSCCYPVLCTEIIGYSVMNRPIPAIRMGSGPLQLHVNAAFHANEWVTSLLLMTFLEDYAQSMKENSILSEKTGRDLAAIATLYAVPMVNPDGVELVQHGAGIFHPLRDSLLAMNGGSEDFSSWKANIRGVDLNDQFPAHWELERARRSPEQPGPRDYVGDRPLSEPEAELIATYTRKHDFDMVIALHTQGREIYWNYRDYEPPHAERIGHVLAERCGYRAVKLTDSDAGFKDWFIQEFRKPGFTVELGWGENPLPITQFSAMYQELLALMEKAIGMLGEK